MDVLISMNIQWNNIRFIILTAVYNQKISLMAIFSFSVRLLFLFFFFLSEQCFNLPCFLSPVVNKSKMLSAGVADVVLKFLQSEMPPVQFKLLGTLRMLIDTQGRDWISAFCLCSKSTKIITANIWTLTTHHRMKQISILKCIFSKRIQ